MIILDVLLAFGWIGEKLIILGFSLPIIGLGFFIVGFMMYREYRVIEDTPIARIHGIPMGFVHIRGKAVGENPLASPLTKTPCFAYQVLVERYNAEATVLKWEDFYTTRAERGFFLDDGTAKIQVNPKDADYDVTKTFVAEVGPKASSSKYLEPSLTGPAPTGQDLYDFMLERREKMALEGTGKLKHQTFRLTENCLIADREHIILGTCSENPAPAGEHDRKMILKGQNEKTLLITSKAEKEAESGMKGAALFAIVLGVLLIVCGAAFWMYVWSD